MSQAFTNQLIHETSPYLLQHAHNPVNWYPWGEEALQKAIAEDKPILVSIGYSACHWCHVMEHESFEDVETAELMNAHFINIKIDREERPDLDHIYMDAVQAMSGSGGWPLNVFLTPDKKPFYGGTYFPPVATYNRMSWKDVLTKISHFYSEKKHEIIAQAENLMQHLENANNFGITNSNEGKVFTEENLNLIAENILKTADTEWGGFGKAPKFPQTFSIQFLLRHYHFTKDEKALQQALISLDKMIAGGIYDHLGGGFARYSTDKEWLAPHFEKMLYDNALLINVLSEAFQITKNENYAEIIKQTIQFIEREMMNAEHGFYSAIDADSEGVEGKFYTWNKKEIEDILKDDAELFCELYNIDEQGNWEHTNILWLTETIENFAERKSLDVNELKSLIISCKEKLLQVRNIRIRPQLDDKILLSWNALMITAVCKAYAAIGEEQYKNMAVNSMNFLESKFANNDGSWHHTYKNNIAKIGAFLDDYAYLIQAYIHLQEITGDGDYLLKAKAMTNDVIINFCEEETHLFYYTNRHQKEAIMRKKEIYDGATASGNSVMAGNLFYLSVVFDEKNWDKICSKMLIFISSAVLRYPTSFGVWASVLQHKVYGSKEIIICGSNAIESLPVLLSAYVPNKIIQAKNSELYTSSFPLFQQKPVAAETDFYLCKQQVCYPSANDIYKFLCLCNEI